MTVHDESPPADRCMIADALAQLPRSLDAHAHVQVVCCASASLAHGRPANAGAAVEPVVPSKPQLFVAPMPYPDVLDETNARRIECASAATARARSLIVESRGATRANAILVGPLPRLDGAGSGCLCATDASIDTRALATRRWVTELDLQRAVQWMLSDAPEFMSGTVIPLDGGMNMGRYL